MDTVQLIDALSLLSDTSKYNEIHNTKRIAKSLYEEQELE